MRRPGPDRRQRGRGVWRLGTGWGVLDVAEQVHRRGAHDPPDGAKHREHRRGRGPHRRLGDDDHADQPDEDEHQHRSPRRGPGVQEPADGDSEHAAGGAQLLGGVVEAGPAAGQMQQARRRHQQEDAAQHHPDRRVGPLDLRLARTPIAAVVAIAVVVRRRGATAAAQCGHAHCPEPDRQGHAHQTEPRGEEPVDLLADRPGRREPDASGHQQTDQDRCQAPDVATMPSNHRAHRSRAAARRPPARPRPAGGAARRPGSVASHEIRRYQ